MGLIARLLYALFCFFVEKTIILKDDTGIMFRKY